MGHSYNAPIPSERDKASNWKMRYVIALIAATSLSIGVFALPWIAPDTSGDVEITNAGMALAVVIELIYAARWLIVPIVFAIGVIQAWAGGRSS